VTRLYGDRRTFDDETIGAAPRGWSVSPAGSILVAADPEPGSLGGNVVEQFNAGASTYANRYLPETYDGPILRVRARMRAEILNPAAHHHHFSLNVSNAAHRAACVSFDCNGDLYYNDADGDNNLIQTFESLRWYDVELWLYMARQRYDVWIDGARVVTGASFEDPAENITYVLLFASPNLRGWFDDVRIDAYPGRYHRALEQLHPPGAYPSDDPDSVHYNATLAESLIFEELSEELAEARLDAFPQTARDSIPDWETAYGLAAGAAMTLQNRRDQIISKERETPEMTVQVFKDIIEPYMGYEPDIYERAGYSVHGDKIWKFSVIEDPLQLKTGYDHEACLRAALKIKPGWADLAMGRSGFILNQSQLNRDLLAK